MTKRLLITSAFIILLLSVALVAAPAYGQDEFNWKQFEGTEITVLMPEHPVTNGIRSVVDRFTEETGIKVNLEALAENLYFDRMELALRAEQGVADVYFLPMDSTAFTQWQAGVVAPITPFLNDQTMTASDYDFADFPHGFLAATEYPPGEGEKQNFGIPASFEAYILFYNKDLVDQYLGGEVPKTMPALLEAAQKISQESGGTVVGSVVRGIRSDTVMDTVTGMVYNSLGEPNAPLPYNVWFDGDWTKPRLTDPRIVRGLADYAGMMKGGPANIQAMDWTDASLLFQQGRVAFFIDASLFGPGFEDPNASTVAGKVGYAPLPPEEEGGKSFTGHWMWGYGIPANAKNPDAGWYFIQWMSNPQNEPIISTFSGGSTRLSTWGKEEYTSALNSDYVSAVQTVMQTSSTTVVFREGWKEYALAIVDAIQAMYGGTDPAEAAQAAQDTILKLVEQSQ